MSTTTSFNNGLYTPDSLLTPSSATTALFAPSSSSTIYFSPAASSSSYVAPPALPSTTSSTAITPSTATTTPGDATTQTLFTTVPFPSSSLASIPTTTTIAKPTTTTALLSALTLAAASTPSAAAAASSAATNAQDSGTTTFHSYYLTPLFVLFPIALGAAVYYKYGRNRTRRNEHNGAAYRGNDDEGEAEEEEEEDDGDWGGDEKFLVGSRRSKRGWNGNENGNGNGNRNGNRNGNGGGDESEGRWMANEQSRYGEGDDEERQRGGGGARHHSTWSAENPYDRHDNYRSDVRTEQGPTGASPIHRGKGLTAGWRSARQKYRAPTPVDSNSLSSIASASRSLQPKHDMTQVDPFASNALLSPSIYAKTPRIVAEEERNEELNRYLAGSRVGNDDLATRFLQGNLTPDEEAISSASSMMNNGRSHLHYRDGEEDRDDDAQSPPSRMRSPAAQGLSTFRMMQERGGSGHSQASIQLPAPPSSIHVSPKKSALVRPPPPPSNSNSNSSQQNLLLSFSSPTKSSSNRRNAMMVGSAMPAYERGTMRESESTLSLGGMREIMFGAAAAAAVDPSNGVEEEHDDLQGVVETARRVSVPLPSSSSTNTTTTATIGPLIFQHSPVAPNDDYYAHDLAPPSFPSHHYNLSSASSASAYSTATTVAPPPPTQPLFTLSSSSSRPLSSIHQQRDSLNSPSRVRSAVAQVEARSSPTVAPPSPFSSSSSLAQTQMRQQTKRLPLAPAQTQSPSLSVAATRDTMMTMMGAETPGSMYGPEDDDDDDKEEEEGGQLLPRRQQQQQQRAQGRITEEEEEEQERVAKLLRARRFPAAAAAIPSSSSSQPSPTRGGGRGVMRVVREEEDGEGEEEEKEGRGMQRSETVPLDLRGARHATYRQPMVASSSFTTHDVRSHVAEGETSSSSSRPLTSDHKRLATLLRKSTSEGGSGGGGEGEGSKRGGDGGLQGMLRRG